MRTRAHGRPFPRILRNLSPKSIVVPCVRVRVLRMRWRPRPPGPRYFPLRPGRHASPPPGSQPAPTRSTPPLDSFFRTSSAQPSLAFPVPPLFSCIPSPSPTHHRLRLDSSFFPALPPLPPSAVIVALRGVVLVVAGSLGWAELARGGGAEGAVGLLRRVSPCSPHRLLFSIPSLALRNECSRRRPPLCCTHSVSVLGPAPAIIPASRFRCFSGRFGAKNCGPKSCFWPSFFFFP
jgi:hypothetical protein